MSRKSELKALFDEVVRTLNLCTDTSYYKTEHGINYKFNHFVLECQNFGDGINRYRIVQVLTNTGESHPFGERARTAKEMEHFLRGIITGAYVKSFIP